MRGYPIHTTRASRRVFARKSQQSISNLRKSFFLRGGGYL